MYCFSFQGKVMAEYDPDTLKNTFTRTFELHANFGSVDNSKAMESIKELLQEHAPESKITTSADALVAKLPYRSESNQLVDYSPLLSNFEEMAREQQINGFRIVSSNLENIFNELILPPKTMQKSDVNGYVHTGDEIMKKNNEVNAVIQQEKLSEMEVIKNLLKKRFLHFKRNYRLILCMLILPTLFEIIAMGFMTLRPPGEHDIDLQFSRALYANSTDVYSIENDDTLENDLFTDLTEYCEGNNDVFGNVCNKFDSSEKLFRWVLRTTQDYPTSRYGGISINGSRAAVWYNNNGYHSMPVFLNELNTAYFRSLMNDTDLKITTNNFPLKLDDKELSQSSM